MSFPSLHWHSPKALRPALVPASLRGWLLEPGSLTRRLRAECPAPFRLELLGLAWARPMGDEAAALGRPAYESAMVREVTLCCGDEAMVFARTVIPRASMEQGLGWLGRIGTRPLGDILFADPGTTRSPVEVVRVPRGHVLRRRSRAPAGAALWGRRSLFVLRGRPLLVSEFFLPRLWQTGPHR